MWRYGHMRGAISKTGPDPPSASSPPLSSSWPHRFYAGVWQRRHMKDQVALTSRVWEFLPSRGPGIVDALNRSQVARFPPAWNTVSGAHRSGWRCHLSMNWSQSEGDLLAINRGSGSTTSFIMTCSPLLLGSMSMVGILFARSNRD